MPAEADFIDYDDPLLLAKPEATEIPTKAKEFAELVEPQSRSISHP
jgi:hypothetical protein